MATIINADTSDGLKLTSDTSGQIDFQSAGSTKATIDTSGNLKFDSGFGSVGTAYGCRAWVNFNGTGTVGIKASGGVSSVTDNAVTQYTINFTTAMPDANYSFSLMSVVGTSGYIGNQYIAASSYITASSLRVVAGVRQDSLGNVGFVDSPVVAVAIFR
jgi:hypothetical protein